MRCAWFVASFGIAYCMLFVVVVVLLLCWYSLFEACCSFLRSLPFVVCHLIVVACGLMLVVC